MVGKELKEEKLKFYKTLNEEIVPLVQTILSDLKSLVTNVSNYTDELNSDNIVLFMDNLNKVSNSPDLTSEFFKNIHNENNN